MQISEQALKQFKALWREDHPAESISAQELEAVASGVLMAVNLVYKPIPVREEK